jgi:histidinol-phosphate aminotransferase
VDGLLSKVTDKTKICFLANPENPTWTYINETELRRLAAGLPDTVVLVIDSAYAEYVDDPAY